MTQLEYHLLDVFTDTPFTGNALAVFVDAPREITTTQMQTLARELNLSETVFVWSPTIGPAWPTRIFTPAQELPFAGHPTVGTALLLAELGLVSRSAVLDEGVGEVTVSFDGQRATFTSPRLPERVPMDAPGALAAAVGLSPDDLHPAFAAQGYSCGVPFAIVPVRDPEAVARSGVVGPTETNFYVAAPLDDSFTAWRARMYAPGLGISEDPATGAAAAAFAGVLADTSVTDLVIAQGVEMGRPSQLFVSLERGADGSLTAVRVGGQAVVVGGGRLRVPQRPA